MRKRRSSFQSWLRENPEVATPLIAAIVILLIFLPLAVMLGIIGAPGASSPVG